jgi:penicillin V acylase-like amidase (Ntn superfamily)
MTGQCAVIEYLDGKMVVHKGDSLTVNVLSNSVYSDAVDYLKEHKGFGGDKVVSKIRTNSLDRFVRAATMVQSYHSNPPSSYVDSGFNILASVAQGDRTVWRIVYDVNNMRIYFRTLLNAKLQYVDMKSFDFSCNTPSKVYDLNNTLSGDVSPHFKEFTQDVNQDFIMRMANIYSLPKKNLNALVSHQYGMSCAQK